MNRHESQAEGNHPAPCARMCEATAYEVEIRRLHGLLRAALIHVEGSAGASHMLEGFRRGPDNALDHLAARIRATTNVPRNV